MAWALYRAKKIGDGLRPATAYRPKIAEYITHETTTQNFWNWVHPDPAVATQICLVKAPPVLHATLAADPDIEQLSPVVTAVTQFEPWLNTPTVGGTMRDDLKQLQIAHHRSGAQWKRDKIPLLISRGVSEADLEQHLRDIEMLDSQPADGIGPLRF